MTNLGHLYTLYREYGAEQLFTTDMLACWFCGGVHHSSECEEPVVHLGKARLRKLFQRLDTEEWDEKKCSVTDWEDCAPTEGT